jgi:Domain of unknown function (DUF1824)
MTILQLAPTTENIRAVRQRLAQFSCLATPPKLSESKRQALREDLLWFSEQAEYETLGICADTIEQAQTALMAYIAALGCPMTITLPEHAGVVYVKFNTLKQTWYVDDYPGPSRGVLVAFHTSEPELDKINGTYGPFPFDLFL